jgi:sulfur carrier protein
MQPDVSPLTINVTVNDAAHSVAHGTGLLAMVEGMAMANRPGLAIAINTEVVPRARWAERKLRDGDRVLIIQASQGG